MRFFCAQRGCQHDADEAPESCPVCGLPFVAHPDPLALYPEGSAERADVAAALEANTKKGRRRG